MWFQLTCALGFRVLGVGLRAAVIYVDFCLVVHHVVERARLLRNRIWEGPSGFSCTGLIL